MLAQGKDNFGISTGWVGVTLRVHPPANSASWGEGALILLRLSMQVDGAHAPGVLGVTTVAHTRGRLRAADPSVRQILMNMRTTGNIAELKSNDTQF